MLMKKCFFLCAIGCLIIGAIGCTNATSNNSATAPLGSGAVKQEEGEKLYKTYCKACHGINGDMGGSGAFDLTKSRLSLEERITVISEGRNLMTPFSELLNDEQIKAVGEYIETLRTDQ